MKILRTIFLWIIHTYVSHNYSYILIMLSLYWSLMYTYIQRNQIILFSMILNEFNNNSWKIKTFKIFYSSITQSINHSIIIVSLNKTDCCNKTTTNCFSFHRRNCHNLYFLTESRYTRLYIYTYVRVHIISKINKQICNQKFKHVYAWVCLFVCKQQLKVFIYFIFFFQYF